MTGDLPVNKFEAQILELVAKEPVAVIIGETGSGKTTQLSQILYRAQYAASGIIGITQPRRVAAVTVARRVAYELGVQVGDEVGYSIRFEDRTSAKTCIKYLTDGCLLRECLSDADLQQYSVIILDEAHERSLNTDILFGLLKRLAGRESPGLKIIITSATLDGEKISQFFNGCPVLHIPGMLFPVKILYSSEQPVNYLESALQTALDVHIHEGPGDILLFLTGQDEIQKAVSKLEERIQVLDEGSCMDAIILPLHASLPPEMQVRVFTPAPPNCRRIIFATNIAETSLTVDGVVYVIDPGFVKQRQYSPATGMYSLVVVQISRVQATQRAGRAGRTRPGKCYRLYTEAVFENDLPRVTVPEIQRSSLTGAVLHLKSLDLPDVNVLEFNFLDPPSRTALEDGLQQLYMIDAIDEDGIISASGKQMAELPLEPSLARTLLAAEESGCLHQALTVAAMLSCETFISSYSSKGSSNKRLHMAPSLPDGKGMGDHIQLLQIYDQWHQMKYDLDWCEQHHLQTRSMLFAREVRKQLSAILQKNAKGSAKCKFEDVEMTCLRKALCTGFANRLAQRMPRHNGYRTIGAKSQLVQIHPSACSMAIDDEGLLPEWIVYNELISTGRPYVRQVCAVAGPWCKPVLIKMSNFSLERLSGSSSIAVHSGKAEQDKPREDEQRSETKHDNFQGISIVAARQRFLCRKKAKIQSGTHR